MKKCDCDRPEYIKAPIEPYRCYRCGNILPERWHEYETDKPVPKVHPPHPDWSIE